MKRFGILVMTLALLVAEGASAQSVDECEDAILSLLDERGFLRG